MLSLPESLITLLALVAFVFFATKAEIHMIPRAGRGIAIVTACVLLALGLILLIKAIIV